MYLKYYCLSNTPFGITPDPAFLFLSASHKEALASLLYGIEKRKGFICVTGEVGCGKTTVLKALLARVNTEQVKTVYLYNPELSFENLIRAVFEELGLGAPDSDTAASIRRLHVSLIEFYRQGKHVVLIVDEAQRMPVETLERLRILSNLETAQDKLLQIVLCGQPELEEVLAVRELRQLRERIAVHAAICPLNPGESLAYVQHRLGRVAYGTTPVFEPAALKHIIRHARGNPRRINILCDNALVAGYADQKRPIPARVVREAVAGLPREKRAFHAGKWAMAACGVALIAAVGALALFGGFTPRVSGASVDGMDAVGTVEASTPSLAAKVPEPAPVLLEERAEPVRIEATAPSSRQMELMPQLAVAAVPMPSLKPETGAETAPAEPETVEIQAVKAGDSLSRLLARAYGQSSQELINRTLEINTHIKDANKIQVGDIIVLPGTSGQESQHD